MLLEPAAPKRGCVSGFSPLAQEGMVFARLKLWEIILVEKQELRVALHVVLCTSV